MKNLEKTLEHKYKEKIRELIKKKLQSVISNEEILENPNKKINIKVPIIDEPYFKPKVISPSSGNSARGPLPNGEDENAQYELEVSLDIEELTDILFEHLALPSLKKKLGILEEEEIRVKGLSKVGPFSRLHRRETFKQIVKLNKLDNGVFRFRDIRTDYVPTFSAHVYFIRDFSASMDEKKRFKVRSAAFWILQFLRKNYPSVNLKFVLHDTKAFFTNEKEFFQLSIEEVIGINKDQARDFRTKLIIKISALQKENKQNIDYNINPKIKEAIEKKVMEDKANFIRGTITSYVKSEEQISATKEAKEYLKSHYGFCDMCAEDAINFVAYLLDHNV